MARAEIPTGKTNSSPTVVSPLSWVHEITVPGTHATTNQGDSKKNDSVGARISASGYPRYLRKDFSRSFRGNKNYIHYIYRHFKHFERDERENRREDYVKKINVMKKTYHLCLSGGDEILFRDEEDYNRGFNCLALALYKTGSTGLVESFQSTHCHKMIQTEDHSGFMYAMRQSYSKYFNHKYQRHGRVGERFHFHLDIVGLHHHLAAMTYVLRNALHHGIVPIPYAYPHCSVNAIFQKEMGKRPPERLLEQKQFHRFIGKKAEWPSHYKMSESGVFLRESVLDIVQVENMYTTPRAFNYYMSRKSGEVWEKEQEKDKLGTRPVRLDTIEYGIKDQPLEKMLIYENGRSDYKKISDIDLCTEIDRRIVPRYGKASVYHLSRSEKQEIGNQLYRQYRIPEAQIRRCLTM